MSDVIYVFYSIIYYIIAFLVYTHVKNEIRSNSVASWLLYWLFTAVAAFSIYYFTNSEDIRKSIENINSLADFFINPAVGLYFLLFTYVFWTLISWILGKEYSHTSGGTMCDGGSGGGGGTRYYRRRGARVQDIAPRALIFAFLFSILMTVAIVSIVWLAGYNLDPLNLIGLILNIFSIIINIPLLAYHFGILPNAILRRKRGI